eukprot:CCRYP_009392-RA/>CCRYP_009392-RA protein AED:0.40 eAED:0.40 QI:0/-1/0/1/-1/0/1/0/241
MKSPPIGRGAATSGSPCVGTTANEPSAFPCPATAKKLGSISITLSLPNHNINLIPVRRAPTAANNNCVPLQPLHQHWESNRKHLYRKSLEFSCITPGQLTAPLGSLATQQANPTRTTLDRVYQFLDYALSHPNASVTYRASDMILAAPTVTPHISLKQKHAAAPVGISFSPKTTITQTIMGPSLPLRKSSKPLCLPLLRPNSVRHTSMPAKSFPCDTSFSKWATRNHPLPSKPTILPPSTL